MFNTSTNLVDLYIYHVQKKKKDLYKYGARMVALVGLGQIGCTPNSITTYGTNGSACVDYMNDAVQLFNGKLVKLVDQINSNFSDAKFIYINSFGMGSGDPTAAGNMMHRSPFYDTSGLSLDC